MLSDAFLGGSGSPPGQVWALELHLLGAVLTRDCSTRCCTSGRRGPDVLQENELRPPKPRASLGPGREEVR